MSVHLLLLHSFLCVVWSLVYENAELTSKWCLVILVVMEAAVVTSIIISASGVFIAVVTNVIVWLVKITKVERDVQGLRGEFDDHRKETREEIRSVNTKIEEVRQEAKEVRQETKEEIKEVRAEMREMNTKLNTKFDTQHKEINSKVDAIAKEVSFMRGAFEALLRGDHQPFSPVDKGGGAMPSVVRDAPRKR